MDRDQVIHMQETSTPQSAPSQQDPQRTGLSKVIFLFCALVVGGGLLITAGVTGYTWATAIQWGDSQRSVSFPVEGNHISVANVETQLIKESGSYRPSTRITLAKGSYSGKLRLIYRNQQNKSIGKPITIDVKGGAFSSGKTETFTATKGMAVESELQSYLHGQVEEWVVVILEAPQDGASTADYNELARIPISRKLTL